MLKKIYIGQNTICVNQPIKPLGCIDLYDDPQHHRAGGVVIKKHRGKGYAKCASLIKTLLGPLQLHQLYAGAKTIPKYSIISIMGYEQTG